MSGARRHVFSQRALELIGYSVYYIPDDKDYPMSMVVDFIGFDDSGNEVAVDAKSNVENGTLSYNVIRRVSDLYKSRELALADLKNVRVLRLMKQKAEIESKIAKLRGDESSDK